MERYAVANYAPTFGWAVLVLLGMVGLGRVVAQSIDDEAARKAGWGLHAAWGTALYLSSPAPHLPFQKSPEQTKRYLNGLGVDYLIFVDFESCRALSSRNAWKQHAADDLELLRIQAPFYLDLFDTMDRLAATETQLGRVGDLTVLQLEP